MGMESFFCSFLAKDSAIILKDELRTYSGSCSKIVKDLLSFLSFKSYKVKASHKKCREDYILDNYLRVWIFQDNSFFQGMSIEGCFSCFEEAIQLMVRTYTDINDSFLSLKTIFPENISHEYLRIIYGNRFEQFNNQFHNAHFLCCPGSDFYRKYKVKRFFRLKYQ